MEANMHKTITSSLARRAGKALVFAGALAALAACETVSGGSAEGGIGYRQARFEQMTAIRTYRACVEDARVLDGKARQTRSPAQYLASAKLLERCESELGPESRNVAVEERMRATGLAAQNHLRGGDVAKAQASLEAFERAFPGRDLYYADGTSFTDTMQALLTRLAKSEYGEFSTLNVSQALKTEMRRMKHWVKN
jgi:hypothetical protein